MSATILCHFRYFLFFRAYCIQIAFVCNYIPAYLIVRQNAKKHTRVSQRKCAPLTMRNKIISALSGLNHHGLLSCARGLGRVSLQGASCGIACRVSCRSPAHDILRHIVCVLPLSYNSASVIVPPFAPLMIACVIPTRAFPLSKDA